MIVASVSNVVVWAVWVAAALACLGSAVAELVSQRHPAAMRIMGVSGFAPTGNAAFLFEHFGLTPDRIAASARELVRRH